jgi:DNA sulfur modification protein DndB
MGVQDRGLEQFNVLGLSSDEAALKREFAKRQKAHLELSVKHKDVAEFLDQGWIPLKESVQKIRLQQPKSIEQQLNDDLWCLLFRMGYRALNISDHVQFSYRAADNKQVVGQVSLMAIDEETCIVIETKTNAGRKRTRLDDDIEQSILMRKQVQATLNQLSDRKSKRKILWIYATRNVIWLTEDADKASQAKIRAITEGDFSYFDTFIKHLGPAGRYQFLAEFFGGQEIPGLDNVKVPATKGALGKKTFYSFVTTPRRLLKIAFINHQSLNHPDGKPAYQRMISPKRIQSIQSFIEGGGFFPTNILVNFAKQCRFDLLSNKENSDPDIKFGWLTLPNTYKSAWIIDGQHRLYGYSHLSDKHLDKPLTVLAFEMLPIKEEAELFITINHEQKSVPKSILVALQADLRINSDKPKEKITALASLIAKSVAGDPSSPFYQRFTVHGIQSLEAQSLTVPEFVNGLVRAGLLGRVVGTIHSDGPLSESLDEKTVKRAQTVLNGFFHTIRDASPVRWEAGRDGYVATNPGVRAFMMLTAAICRHIEDVQGVNVHSAKPDVLLAAIQKIAEPVIEFIRQDDDAQIKEKFSRKFGEGGVREYYENLAEIIVASNDTFGDTDLRQRLALKRDERRTETDRLVNEISRKILDKTIVRLKEVYGDKQSATGQAVFWEVGVKSADIKSKAYRKQLDDSSPKPIEAYLDIVDIKEIIKSNKEHLQGMFSIQLPDDRPGKAIYLDWIDRFNEVRRIAAHPSESRVYSEEDYKFIAVLGAAINSRLERLSGLS